MSTQKAELSPELIINEFKNIIRKVVISKKCKKFNTNVFCLKSDKVSEKVYKYLKKANK